MYINKYAELDKSKIQKYIHSRTYYIIPYQTNLVNPKKLFLSDLLSTSMFLFWKYNFSIHIISLSINLGPKMRPRLSYVNLVKAYIPKISCKRPTMQACGTRQRFYIRISFWFVCKIPLVKLRFASWTFTAVTDVIYSLITERNYMHKLACMHGNQKQYPAMGGIILKTETRNALSDLESY